PSTSRARCHRLGVDSIAPRRPWATARARGLPAPTPSMALSESALAESALLALQLGRSQKGPALHERRTSHAPRRRAPGVTTPHPRRSTHRTNDVAVPLPHGGEPCTLPPLLLLRTSRPAPYDRREWSPPGAPRAEATSAIQLPPTRRRKLGPRRGQALHRRHRREREAR